RPRPPRSARRARLQAQPRANGRPPQRANQPTRYLQLDRTSPTNLDSLRASPHGSRPPLDWVGMLNLFRLLRRGSRIPAESPDAATRSGSKSGQAAENEARRQVSDSEAHRQADANEARRQVSDSEARRQADANEARRQVSDSEARRQADANEA